MPSNLPRKDSRNVLLTNDLIDIEDWRRTRSLAHTLKGMAGIRCFWDKTFRFVFLPVLLLSLPLAEVIALDSKLLMVLFTLEGLFV